MLALAQIDSELKAFESLYAAAIFKFQQKEIDRIGRKAKDGLDIRTILGKNSSELFGFRRQLKNELLNLLTRIRNFGMGQVRDELDRQSATERVA